MKVEDVTKKRPDPTEAELHDWYVNVKERANTINVSKGKAKEFTFDDGFSCIARDQKNADRKHQNSLK